MDKSLKAYGCFSVKGETNLPNQEEISKKVNAGLEPIIFLDSCVCLHIIKVVEYGIKAMGIDLSRILALKEYLSKHPEIRISPFFAFMELCMSSGSFDRNKFRDFKYRMDLFEQIPFKKFRQFRYDFNRDLFIFKDPASGIDSNYKHLGELLKESYCALLKIRSLAIKGLSKNHAEGNLTVFFDWMVNDLDIMCGVEYKLALNIFGGNTAYRKMIGLDSKPIDVKKKLMGTCWDIFHAKNSSNSFRLFEMLGQNIYPYFLTSDTNLFNIFRGLSLTLIKDGGKNFTSSFIMGSDFNFPHLSRDFMEVQNGKMIDKFADRRNHVRNLNKLKLDIMIEQLEIENGISMLI